MRRVSTEELANTIMKQVPTPANVQLGSMARIVLINFSLKFRTEWEKVNTNQVCFSAKGNQYGTFNVPKTGEIKAFKLVYLSGRVAAYGAGNNWGTGGTRLDTIITNTVNQVLSPPQSILHATYYKYSLPGVSASDPELILPEMNPPLAVTAGQTFRVWFGEDLKGASESDNSGTTCADVYVNYRQ
ncbi:uncharacterized protein LOC116296864 [Actinia tenebrosa]|uniref:Uncharacterized protein LOC116296864 n=1 Tax=Actinia tenebrosa TaxID=6105 RepID=A0A6P8HZY2_ACTTE|nr:uncharacterized protein LOC116296864 [Actinia tenebrosa]